MKKYLSIIFMLLFSAGAWAQVNPLGNMYYQHQYLGNPAFAGMETGLSANIIYRKQFTDVPGAPLQQVFTGDYGFGNRTAVGLNLQFSKSGLINRTRAMATYAYHLPLDNSNNLSFGLSLGFNKEYINSRDISGESFDPVTSRFNDQGGRLDGDFGMAFTGKRLTLQGAVINLSHYLKTDPNHVEGINSATFFAATSYRIDVANQITAEPKVAYRGIDGFDDIFDSGIHLEYQNQFSIYGLYHSTKSATLGFGINYQDLITFTGMYTTNTSAMKGYANGDFELGLNLKLRKKN